VCFEWFLNLLQQTFAKCPRSPHAKRSAFLNGQSLGRWECPHLKHVSLTGRPCTLSIWSRPPPPISLWLAPHDLSTAATSWVWHMSKVRWKVRSFSDNSLLYSTASRSPQTSWSRSMSSKASPELQFVDSRLRMATYMRNGLCFHLPPWVKMKPLHNQWGLQPLVCIHQLDKFFNLLCSSFFWSYQVLYQLIGSRSTCAEQRDSLSILPDSVSHKVLLHPFSVWQPVILGLKILQNLMLPSWLTRCLPSSPIVIFRLLVIAARRQFSLKLNCSQSHHWIHQPHK